MGKGPLLRVSGRFQYFNISDRPKKILRRLESLVAVVDVPKWEKTTMDIILFFLYYNFIHMYIVTDKQYILQWLLATRYYGTRFDCARGYHIPVRRGTVSPHNIMR